jgi:hypothetical protein
MDEQRGGTLEGEVVRLLADGRIEAVRQLRHRADGHAPSLLLAQLVELDIGSREMRTTLPELQQLQERLAASPEAQSRYGLWAAAVVAERMFLDGDPAAGTWAWSQLSSVTGEPYPPFPVLYARARLSRIACLWPALEPSPANLAAFRKGRDLAVRDFLRCGFPAEAAVTKAVTAGTVFILTREDPWEARDRMAEARVSLTRSPASSWAPSLHAQHGLVNLFVGDLAAAHVAWDEVEHDPGPLAAGHPMVHAYTRFGRALTRLLARRDESAIREVESIVVEWCAVAPQHAVGLHSNLAHLLADLGCPAMTRHVGPATAAIDVGRASQIRNHLLRMRADLATGVVPPAGDVKDRMRDLAQLHLCREAGILALRIARDFERLGQHGDGQALREWGLQMLPHPRQQTLWELLLSRSLGVAAGEGLAGRPAAARAGGPSTTSIDGVTSSDGDVGIVTIRVLTPAVEAEVGGVVIGLRETGAKLLLALVIRHPQPLHVEQAAELLWPGLALGQARHRLNSVVHRLRWAAPPLARGVRRRRDLLSLDERCCAADLWAYRAALAGDAHDQLPACVGVAGNLGHAQFPYDELFVEERRSFVSQWLRVARSLVAAGEVTPEELSRPLAALDLGPADLD